MRAAAHGWSVGRRPGRGVEPNPVDSPLSTTDRLQRHLLRRCVGELTADRHSCRDCERTPLIGERVYIYDGGEVVCELCRQLHREAPRASQLVRHSEHGHAVRLTVRAA